MTSNGNLLGTPVPGINISLLLPKKHIKEKRKYTKGNKTNKLKQKIAKVFDQFARKRGRPKKMSESWYEQLKKTVSDLFNTKICV